MYNFRHYTAGAYEQSNHKGCRSINSDEHVIIFYTQDVRTHHAINGRMAYKSVSKVFGSYKQPTFVKILIAFTLSCNAFYRIAKKTVTIPLTILS